MLEIAALILKGTGDAIASMFLAVSVDPCSRIASLVSAIASLVSWETIASLVSGSAIGSNWLSVVNWKMGIEVPLSGVIPIGGSAGPGLLWGVSVQLSSSSSSMWVLFPYCSCCGRFAALGCGCSWLRLRPSACCFYLRLV